MLDAATSDNITDFEIYKRVLKQRADPSQIAQLVEAISSRLNAGLSKAFDALEYSFGFTVEKHSSKFDFDNGDKFVLVSLQTGKDQLSAVVCLPHATASAIADLMLGADPSFIVENDVPGLNDIQKTLVDEFIGVVDPVIQDVLNVSQPMQRQFSKTDYVEKNFDDFVNLEMALQCAEQSFSFSLLLAQREMLKVKIRQKPRDTVEPAVRPVTPDKDVELDLCGVVEVSSLTLEDIACLTVGEKVPLTGSGDGDVILMANGRKLHKCRIGQNHSSYALLVEGSYQAMHSILNTN
ncbi:MAG: FliM/FliN family flagellar motor switch protein [Pseudomonadota bacterium]